MSIRFDINGNIDPTTLEKDLQMALHADVKYKQTDNMKKRAIKVAGSYEEFKNMVACAHLKKVSSQDIESLKEVKKGWRKQRAGQASSSLLQAEAEASVPGHSTSAPFIPEAERRKVPKTFTAFYKIWRRLESCELKYSYLRDVGVSRIHKLLTAECDVEVLEDIVSVLLAKGRMLGEFPEKSAIQVSEIISWFRSLVSLQTFEFNSKFFSSAVKEAACAYLENCADPSAQELKTGFLS